MTMSSIFASIIDWEIDPRDEDIKRLFFHKPGVQDVIDGKKQIVVGRKGSGKTSIAEFIRNTNKSFSRVFSLSYIDIGDIDSFLDAHNATHHNYRLFWKYIIYFAALEILVKSGRIDYKTAKSIKEVFKIGSDDDLLKRISYLRNLDFSLSAFGFEAAVSSTGTFAELSIQDKCDLIERILIKYNKGQVIDVIFDEIDSQFALHQTEIFERYHVAITHLLVCAIDVKRSMKFVNPIVVIRDDIFDIVVKRFSESNKLIDKVFYLNWSKDDLTHMLNHRLSVGAGSISVVTRDLFSDQQVVSKLQRHKQEHKIMMSIFDFFYEHTMLRPRDVILLLRELSKRAILDKKAVIDSNVFKSALPYYSIRFKQELIDEISGSLINISEIFDEIVEMKSTRFNIDQLRDTLEDAQIGDLANVRRIVDRLIYFSVVGISEGSLVKFRYLDGRIVYVPNVSVELHPGLRDSLKFYDQYVSI